MRLVLPQCNVNGQTTHINVAQKMPAAANLWENYRKYSEQNKWLFILNSTDCVWTPGSFVRPLNAPFLLFALHDSYYSHCLLHTKRWAPINFITILEKTLHKTTKDKCASHSPWPATEFPSISLSHQFLDFPCQRQSPKQYNTTSSSSLFGMHHQCVAPLPTNSLHSGLFRASSIASSKERLCQARSFFRAAI